MFNTVSSPPHSSASQSSSPDHIAIDIGALEAGMRASKRSASPALTPRQSSSALAGSEFAGETAQPRSATAVKLQGLLIRGANKELQGVGKKDNIAAARENLAFLQQAIRHLLEQRDAIQAAYLEEVKALLSVDGLKQPRAASGKLTRGADGRLESRDPFVDAVVKFVDAKFPGELARLNVADGTKVALPLEAGILLKAKEFEHGCKVRQIGVHDADQPVPVDIDLKTYTARQAIKKAAQAFSPDARLNVDLDPLRGASPNDGEASTFHGGQAEKPAPEMHPFAFLQDVTYRVESDNAALKQLIERAFNDPKPAHLWPATLELRGRLGAHAINTVFNQKTFDWKLGAAMGLSVVGSTLIALAIDQFGVGKADKAAIRKWGEKSAKTKALHVGGESIAPQPAEMFDSGVVSRVIAKMRGENVLWDSKEEFFDDMKDSAISGMIAALGSVPNNAVQLSHSGLAVVGNVATNVLATATSAAMAPLKVAQAEENAVLGVIEQRQRGFFPTPNAAAGSMDRREAAQALEKEVRREIQGALDVTPGISDTIHSMGIGQVISLLANFGVFLPLARAHLISELQQKIGTVAVNTPTEVLSLGTGIATSKLSAFGLASDADKERLIAALILDKARQRVENAAQGKPDASIEITEDELRKIEHPAAQVTFHTGKAITKGMNAAINAPGKLLARVKKTEPSLADRAALAAARPTIEEV